MRRIEVVYVSSCGEVEEHVERGIRMQGCTSRCTGRKDRAQSSLT
jgi:hypothetical protein